MIRRWKQRLGLAVPSAASVAEAHEAAQPDPEVHRELELALGRWQRNRVILYAAVFAGLAIVQMVVRTVEGLLEAKPGLTSASFLFVQSMSLLVVLVYAATAWYLLRHTLRREQVVRLFFAVVIGLSIISVAYWVVLVELVPAEAGLKINGNDSGPALTEARRGLMIAGSLVGMMFVQHALASLFVGLSFREALALLIGLWLVHGPACIVLARSVHPTLSITLAVAALAVGVPGLLWSLWRHSVFVEKFERRFMGGRYREVRRDLGEARRVHEALFAAPITTGPVLMRFVYEPKREIGGDFVFARTLEGGGFLIAVVDVTGHGIASALAVARIHDELDRLASGPDAECPARVIAGLNRFTHRHLAKHSVYATACCAVLSANGSRLRWTSAGHPPAFVRYADGSLVELEANAMLLGALAPEQYETAEGELSLAPGDAFLTYTDGVIEADIECGRAFGLEGVRRVLAAIGPAKRLDEAVMDAVRGHRTTASTDDTLVVEVRRATEC